MEKKPKLYSFMEEIRRTNNPAELFGLSAAMALTGKEKFLAMLNQSCGKYAVFENYLIGSMKFDEEKYNVMKNICNYYFRESSFYNVKNDETTIIHEIARLIDEELYSEIAELQFGGWNYGHNTTPRCVCDLVLKLLNISGDKKTFLDLCSGTGNMLLAASNLDFDLELYGSEINDRTWTDSQCRMILSGARAKIEKRDILSEPLFSSMNHPSTYDYVFCQPPFGLKSDLEDLIFKTSDWKYRPVDLEKSKRQNEFLFIACLINHLSINGKGIVVLPMGVLFRGGREKKWRQQLIRNGLLEAVISLPEGLLTESRIPITLMMFSHGNQKIKLINATKEFDDNFTSVCFSERNIARIYNIFQNNEENEYCCIVDYNDIAENDFNLDPVSYLLKNKVIIDNPEFLGKGNSEIGFGLNLVGKQVEIRLDDTSEYEALNSSDFDNYGLVSHLKRIKGTETEFSPYLIQKDDLIVTARGSIFKSMVADFDQNRKVVLMTKTLMFVRVDRNIWDPYYIKMFLDSEIGHELIQACFVGSTIKSLSKSAFQELKLPHISLAKQRELAKEYKKRLKEYKEAITFMEEKKQFLHFYDQYMS